MVTDRKIRKKQGQEDGWVTMLLSDCAVFNESTYSSKEGWSDISYLDTGNITDNRVGEIQNLIVGEDKIPSRAKRKIKPGDIVYSTVRPNKRHYGILREPPENLLVSTGFATIRGRHNLANTDFIYWYITQDKIVEQLQTIAEHSTTAYPSIRAEDIGRLRITAPTLAEQSAIAHILSTLEDKIELNRRMNETLETIAHALFKSWFVDFDPVRAKAKGCPTGLPLEISDLFPDELVESEIGEMPKWWEVTGLSSQLSFVLGGDWGKANFSDQTPNRCFCIRGADIANLQCFKASDMPTRYLKSSSFAKRSLKPWDVVFEISGGSPTQSTGRTVLVTPELLENYSTPLTTSNFCRLLRFNSQASSLFHYYSFRSAYDLDEYYQYETGTTGIKNFGFKYYSEEIKYVLPSKSCLNAFFKVVTPMIKKSGLALQENEALSSLRDNLLPKLISGQLRIPDAEKLIEKASV